MEENADVIFQKIVEKTIKGIPGTANCLDGIIVTGITKKEHLTNLQLSSSVTPKILPDYSITSLLYL